jgi:glycosyltransferase involved in cell wall biosynthesis
MRILMVLDNEFPPDLRVENELEALTQAGHSVHIACYTRENRLPEETLNGVVIHRKYIPKLVYKSSVGALRYPMYFNFWRNYLSNLFTNHNFDAIHIHDLPLAKVGKELAKRYHLKFVLDLHENWPGLLEVSEHTKSLLGRFLSKQKQWKKYELKYCSEADNIIVVVDEAKKRLEDKGIKGNKIKVVSNTLNLNHFKLPDEKPDQNFITALYAGGINQHRGLQYVIQGIKYLKGLSKPFRLWILGKGIYQEKLIEIAKSEGVSDRVVFFGWKPYEEMQKYFGKSDICLIPHLKNAHTDSTIPHKLFQYIYAKKPVIASNCSPIERIIKETKSGFSYKHDDPSDFSKKVQLLIDELNNPNLIDLNYAKQLVNKKYNWKVDSKTLVSIYK